MGSSFLALGSSSWSLCEAVRDAGGEAEGGQRCGDSPRRSACRGPGPRPGDAGESMGGTRGMVEGRSAWERAEEQAGSPLLLG